MDEINGNSVSHNFLNTTESNDQEKNITQENCKSLGNKYNY